MPHGVTVANASGLTTGSPGSDTIFGHSDPFPGGLSFITVNANFVRGTPLRIMVQFSNPFRMSLSTFFRGNYDLLAFAGDLF